MKRILIFLLFSGSVFAAKKNSGFKCFLEIHYDFTNHDSFRTRVEVPASSKKKCEEAAKDYQTNLFPESVKKKKVIAIWESR